jgi:hypothetical protein
MRSPVTQAITSLMVTVTATGMCGDAWAFKLLDEGPDSCIQVLDIYIHHMCKAPKLTFFRLQLLSVL